MSGKTAWQGVQLRLCGGIDKIWSFVVWLQALSDEFPRSDWVVCQAAIAHYNLRNFDEAQDLFEDLLDRDPHRIEVQSALVMSLLWSLHGRAPPKDDYLS